MARRKRSTPSTKTTEETKVMKGHLPLKKPKKDTIKRILKEKDILVDHFTGSLREAKDALIYYLAEVQGKNPFRAATWDASIFAKHTYSAKDPAGVYEYFRRGRNKADLRDVDQFKLTDKKVEEILKNVRKELEKRGVRDVDKIIKRIKQRIQVLKGSGLYDDNTPLEVVHVIDSVLRPIAGRSRRDNFTIDDVRQITAAVEIEALDELARRYHNKGKEIKTSLDEALSEIEKAMGKEKAKQVKMEALEELEKGNKIMLSSRAKRSLFKRLRNKF